MSKETEWAKIQAETMEKLIETVNVTKEQHARILELEQKIARRGGGGDGAASLSNTWGAKVVANSDQLTRFSTDRTRPSRLSLSFDGTVQNMITSDPVSGGSLSGRYRDAAIMMPQRRRLVRDLFGTPVKVTAAGVVEYPRQTERSNNASPVAEGAAKPQSGYSFTMEEVAIRTIAHWVPASRQILDDAPQLQALIDGELRYGLVLVEEEQLLNGDGNSPNLTGLMPEAQALVPITLPSGPPNRMDVIGMAILQNALAGFVTNGIVMNPADWMRIRLMKNADGEYLLGPPGQAVDPMLFGLPVVETLAMEDDDFLVGDFQSAATLYDRWQARVEVSTEHADFFTRNLVAVLAEERIALGVKRGNALTKGSFADVAPDPEP